VKATSRGQVTLPAKWRKNFKTNQYLIKEQGRALIITPLDVDELDDSSWDIVFDAKRDNKGKAVPIDDFLKILKKTL